MTCHNTKDNAGLYRFIPDSKTITIVVVSFLFFFHIIFYSNNNFKLCFSLADTAVRKQVKIFNEHKRATSVFIYSGCQVLL